MIKIILIVQARVSSTRFPNKVLCKLQNATIIEWINYRISKSNNIDDFVFAIPDNHSDDILSNKINKLGSNLFRGDENNVLKRYYETALEFKATHIVRLCADNPLVLPSEIDRLIDNYFKSNCDYMYNHIPLNNLYPDGLGAEIISFDLLKKMYNKVNEFKHLEHCFSFITDNHNLFKIETFNPTKKNRFRPDLKFDVDVHDDLLYLNSKNYNMDINFDKIIKFFGSIEELS